MSGPYHIVDNDDLTGFKIYRQVERSAKLVPVLVKAGAVFSTLEAACSYVEFMNGQGTGGRDGPPAIRVGHVWRNVDDFNDKVIVLSRIGDDLVSYSHIDGGHVHTVPVDAFRASFEPHIPKDPT